MKVKHIEFLVEEPSMEAFLRELLPGLLHDVTFEVYPSLCKDDLLKHLPERLKGYAKWLQPSWRVVVVVDRDDDDCQKLKRRLEHMAKQAGLATRSVAKGRSFVVLNRIAIEELEAWYFGDWEAVRAAYPKVNPDVPKKAKYRNPDAINGGTWEAFERVLKGAGYFAGGLRKIEAARKIASCMDVSRNTSPSFQAFRDALVALCREAR